MKTSNNPYEFFDKHRDLVRLINMNFIIRVYMNFEGEKHRTLVGAGRITKYMAKEDALKQFDKVLNGNRSKSRGGTETFLDWNLLQNRVFIFN